MVVLERFSYFGASHLKNRPSEIGVKFGANSLFLYFIGSSKHEKNERSKKQTFNILFGLRQGGVLKQLAPLFCRGVIQGQR